MNKENLNYLKDNLKFHGFGEKLHAELEQKITEGAPNFQLQLNTTTNGKSLDFILNFRRADNSDMYFFNSYSAKLDRGIKENIEQTFYINKGRGITAKEAYNLLDGRSVFKEMMSKEGAPYHSWIQLDPNVKDRNGNYNLKYYHTNYGFEMGKSLAQLPIKELHNDEDRIKLVRSLEKGNVQSVTFERKGKDERMFIEANPQYKTFNIYDGEMKRIKKGVADDKTKMSSVKRQEGINKSVAVKSDKKNDAKKVTGNTKDKESNSLLPKKRVNKTKGLTQ